MRWVKIGENALEYSLQDTARNALFLVTSRVERFVGQTATDTVAVRVGAILSAVMAMLGKHYGWSTALFAAINVGLAAAWIGFVVLIGRENRQRSAMHAAMPARLATSIVS